MLLGPYIQLSLDHHDSGVLDVVVEATLNFGALSNLPFDVTPESLRDALLAANDLGINVAQQVGDEAYRRLQAGYCGASTVGHKALSLVKV